MSRDRPPNYQTAGFRLRTEEWDAVVIGVCALLFSGCASEGPDASSAPREPVPSEAVSTPGPPSYTADGVPVWFAEREELPPCPVVQLGGRDVLTLPQTACLEGDVGSGAELLVRQFTVDSLGYEIRYRRLPGGAAGLDVMTDGSVDIYGGEGWK